MSTWNLIGGYLGRPIRVRFLGPHDSVEKIADVSLKSTVLLIYFTRGYASAQTNRRLIEALVQSRPLALVLAGLGASDAFDETGSLLSRTEDGADELVMTSFVQDESPRSMAEALLYGTWPSEDRFGNWRHYSILVVGGESALGSSFVEAIKLVAATPNESGDRMRSQRPH